MPIPDRLRALRGPRSPLARAVLPVVGGLVLLLAIFGATLAIAAWISRGGAESSERLAPTSFAVGSVERWADEIDEAGPVLFPGLNTTSGERTLVLDHAGTDPIREWRVYWAYPADADPSCAVEQIRHTDRFTDCTGREIGVAELAPPVGVCPVVEDRKDLSINLRCGPEAPATTERAGGAG